MLSGNGILFSEDQEQIHCKVGKCTPTHKIKCFKMLIFEKKNSYEVVT
jgi:hypothetical protein